MLNEKQLMELGIENWSTLSKKFDGADLLLGNGFSINLGKFNYKSLFDEFLKNLSRYERGIFESFNTTNFEFIQENLLSAKTVNKLFNIKDNNGDIDKAIDTLKNGLIKSIGNNHPKKDQINWPQLHSLSIQLTPFKDIYTLNYDLFLYHIIMQMKDESAKQRVNIPYSDYFWGEEPTNQYVCYMGFDDNHEKHIFYLHGALFIFKISPETYKLKRSGKTQELVSMIGEEIHKGRMPLFVSEGTSQEKEKTIEQSVYLGDCLKSLEVSGSKLVIFGSSLSYQDQHIINAINYKENNNRELAIAIHVVNKSTDDLENIIKHLKDTFKFHKTQFFDSTTLFHF